MSAPAATLPRRPPRRALSELIVTEAKCAWRAPVGLALGVLVPVIILVILGSVGGLQKIIPGSNPPVTYMTAYVPVLIGLVLVMIALISLPIVLVNQREHGFLRRLSTTPVAPRWLLAAQVAVNVVLAVVAMIMIVAGAALFYHVPAPAQLGGFVLSALLAMAALFAIGLFIAAVAANGVVAAVLGTLFLYPLIFFAGLWVPRQSMSPAMRHISDYTPLGAGVHSMLSSMQGSFPPRSRCWSWPHGRWYSAWPPSSCSAGSSDDRDDNGHHRRGGPGRLGVPVPVAAEERHRDLRATPLHPSRPQRERRTAAEILRRARRRPALLDRGGVRP